MLGGAPVPAVPPLHAPGGRVGRSASAKAHPRGRRRPAGDPARHVPIAYALDALTIWQLYAVAFGVGVGTVFFDVAYQSYLPAAGSAGSARRGQLEARGQPLWRADRRPGAGGSARRSAHGARTRSSSTRSASSARPASSLASERKRSAPSERRTHISAASSSRASVTCSATATGARSPPAPRRRTSSRRSTSRSSSSTRCASSACPRSSSASRSSRSGSAGSRGAVLANRIATRFGVGPTIIGAAALFGPAALLVPLAPTSSPLPFLAPLVRASRRRRDRLQHHRHQPRADADAGAAPREAQRQPPLHRLGDDPARRADRRRARHGIRAADDARDRSGRRVYLLPAHPLLAASYP